MAATYNFLMKSYKFSLIVTLIFDLKTRFLYCWYFKWFDPWQWMVRFIPMTPLIRYRSRSARHLQVHWPSRSTGDVGIKCEHFHPSHLESHLSPVSSKPKITFTPASHYSLFISNSFPKSNTDHIIEHESDRFFILIQLKKIVTTLKWN